LYCHGAKFSQHSANHEINIICDTNMSTGFDARQVANFILDARDFIGNTTTQIELQKLLFFAHEAFLIRTRKKLVSGYFEAWTYGPVHPAVYNAFKASKHFPIGGRADALDLVTNQRRPIPELNDHEAKRHITETVARLSGLSAGQLIELSHIPGGAWSKTVEQAKNAVALGLRITDDLVLSSKPHSMLMREAQLTVNIRSASLEETPLTRGRLS
jgi:uncharacterized phage-associated protein